MARFPQLLFLAKTQLHAFKSEIQKKSRVCRKVAILMEHSQCAIWDVHKIKKQEIIFLRCICLRFRPLAKMQCHAFRSEIQNKPRPCRNSTKLWGYFQWSIWYTHAKIQQEIIFLNRVCLHFRSWQKCNCTRSGRKFKINRGLAETLRNFRDTRNILFKMSMQKISRKCLS